MLQDEVLFRRDFGNLDYYDIRYNHLKTQNSIQKLNLSNYIQFQRINDVVISEDWMNLSDGQILVILCVLLKNIPF